MHDVTPYSLRTSSVVIVMAAFRLRYGGQESAPVVLCDGAMDAERDGVLLRR